MKRENAIDFPQLCLLRLPLWNMDSAQLSSWLCLEIDTLSMKGCGFLEKSRCQAGDGPDTDGERRWIGFNDGTSMPQTLNPGQRETRPTAGTREQQREEEVGKVLSPSRAPAQTRLLRSWTRHACVFMSSHRHMLFNDKDVITIMAMVNTPPPPPLKIWSKNKHTGHSKWKRLIFVKCALALP